MYYVNLIQVIPTLICLDYWSSVFLRQEVLRSMAHMNAGRSRTVRTLANEEAVNCSCETKIVGKLTQYWTRIWTISTKGPRNTSWRYKCIHTTPRRATIWPLWMQFYEWPQHQYTADELFLRSILWTDEVCFTCDGVFLRPQRSPTALSTCQKLNALSGLCSIMYLEVFDDLGKWITCDYFLSFG
jgi:hypothetical protein